MGRSWYKFLCFVLLAHILLLGLKLHETMVRQIPPGKSPDKTVMKVQLTDQYPSLKRQIVQSEDGESQKDRPMDDAYLSDKTRTFDRETQAKKIAPFHAGGKGMGLSDLGAFHKDHDPYKKAAGDYAKKTRGDKQGSGGSQRGTSSSSDHVLEIPLGDVTHLNTVEYKYYGFFLRIRQRLEQFWGRSIQEKAELLMDQGRSIKSQDEHITALEITLSEDGEIIEIFIKATSGIKELDDAAIESFNEAGPFPNPPRGLLVNGRVTIEWGFVVKS